MEENILDANGLMTDAHQLRTMLHGMLVLVSEVTEALDGEDLPVAAAARLMALVAFAFHLHSMVCEDQAEQKEHNPWQLFSQE